ncbi:MAG: tRNA-dihydrouridine synthase family protein [Eubacteriales bacterium]|nr:tRNA-dihydrouridine synthase family protein [Eubacteriales bacterium]
MEICFAPLEGIGNYIFRNTFLRHYQGVDAFYTPFIELNSKGDMKKRNIKDILPENNVGIRVIPQVITRRVDELVPAALKLRDYGYDEVNINMGCPVATETSKGKGSGMLKDKDSLKSFLDEAFSRSPLPLSVKCRIGWESTEEASGLIEIFNDYPLKSLIIHPRLRAEFYNGSIHEDILHMMYTKSRNPVIINPSIKSECETDFYFSKYPDAVSLMIGRGIVANPELALRVRSRIDALSRAAEATGQNSKETDEAETLKISDIKRFFEFHDDLLSEYRVVMSGDVPVMHKLKELWFYWKDTLPVDERLLKRIKKSDSIDEYLSVLSVIR